MPCNVICNIIGLALCFIGTFVSLYLIVTIKYKQIEATRNWGYQKVGVAKNASSQKAVGMIGLSILLVGTAFQVVGNIGSTNQTTLCILALAGSLFIGVVSCWSLLKRHSEHEQLEKEDETKRLEREEKVNFRLQAVEDKLRKLEAEAKH